MAGSLLNRLSRALQKFEQTIDIIFGRGFPPGGLCAIECSYGVNQLQPINIPGRSIKDVLNDSILWAVPKSRRSIEKRLKRKFGVPKYNWKPHIPKTNILMCTTCGHNYQAGLLCAHCYERVKKETKEIQSVIQQKLGLKPIEQEVVVLYEGEYQEDAAQFWKGQRVVELPKKRPAWFDKNLLQSSTEEPEDTKDIKPKDLA